MSKVFFSIITPVLNGEFYIDNFIKTLTNQTYKNWEAIIIDDHSSDNTYKYLRKKSEFDKRFKIYKNQNNKEINSPYAARNYGLNKSNGLYICFLDIDDYWYKEKLAIEYEIIKNKNIDILVGNYIKANNKLTSGYLKPRIKFISIKSQLFICNPFPMLSTTVKFSKIKRLKFKSLFHEDYIFWKELVNKNKNIKIHFHKNIIAIYRIRENSLSYDRFKTIFWLRDCYKYFEYNRFIIYPILFLRTIFFLIEKYAVKFKFLKTKELKFKK